jgi:dolichyl-phosphate beta-glucosyltransferase
MIPTRVAVRVLDDRVPSSAPSAIVAFAGHGWSSHRPARARIIYRSNSRCEDVTSVRVSVPAPFLSVIVPVFNEESRIRRSLQALSHYLDNQPYPWEVIIVDDGSTDATREAVCAWTADRDTFRLEAIPHGGKGAAVRHGMLLATGKHRFMCDADLAMPIELLGDFLELTTAGWDVVIGSRQMAAAKCVGEATHRRFLGRVFNKFVQLVAVRGFDDTQCGFKCFRGEAADALFSLQRTTGWGFDVEILYLAHKKNMRIVQTPIECHYDEFSKVHLLSAGPRMLSDVLILRMRAALGLYDSGRNLRRGARPVKADRTP